MTQSPPENFSSLSDYLILLNGSKGNDKLCSEEEQEEKEEKQKEEQTKARTDGGKFFQYHG
jgi:hypothetical protein